MSPVNVLDDKEPTPKTDHRVTPWCTITFPRLLAAAQYAPLVFVMRRHSIYPVLVVIVALDVSVAFSSRHGTSGRHTSTTTPTNRLPVGRHRHVTTTPLALAGWRQQATVFYEHDADDSTYDRPAARVLLEECSAVTTNEGTFDISSPRAWLEHGSPDGAYTVMRCDLLQPKSASTAAPTTTAATTAGEIDNTLWNIWGLDFHVRRLRQSLSSFAAEQVKVAVDVDVDLGRLDTSSAEVETQLVIRALLAKAAAKLSPVLVREGDKANNDICIVVMVTILWFLDHDDGTRIRVKGHIYTSGVPSDPTKYDPEPIPVALALAPPTDTGTVTSLPSRKDSYPEAKLSAWCRERRPLEVQFKQLPNTSISNGVVGEVILVDRQHAANTNEHDGDAAAILLEGLTSNLFVLYPGGMLRTAATGVLPGYARQRILEQATLAGLTLDFTPIRLDESELWVDCFLTSSIKLVAPVATILVPVAGEDGTITKSQEVWSRDKIASARSVWRELYNTIILENQIYREQTD
jgi:hypothetical protein